MLGICCDGKEAASVGSLARRAHHSLHTVLLKRGSGWLRARRGAGGITASRRPTDRVHRTVDHGGARPGGAEVHPYEAALRRHRPHRTNARHACNGGAAAEQVDRALTRAPCRSGLHNLQPKAHGV